MKVNIYDTNNKYKIIYADPPGNIKFGVEKAWVEVQKVIIIQ